MAGHPWIAHLDGDKFSRTPLIANPEEAAAVLGEALDATARTLPVPDALLLSGGVDSMLAAIAACRTGYRPACVTMVTDVDDPSLDGVWARRCAEHLGLEWYPAVITPERIRSLITLAIRHIGGRGLYQVARAVTDVAAADLLSDVDADHIWSGTGADLLFGAYPDVDDPDGPVRLDWEGREKMLRRARALDGTNPYAARQAILRYAGFTTHAVFETVACLAISARCEPVTLVGEEACRTDRASTTKWPLRLLAADWGLPPELVAQPKRALQDSSGVFRLMAECARFDEFDLCDDFTSQTPRRHGRDADTMTAYWLQLLDR